MFTARSVVTIVVLFVLFLISSTAHAQVVAGNEKVRDMAVFTLKGTVILGGSVEIEGIKEPLYLLRVRVVRRGSVTSWRVLCYGAAAVTRCTDLQAQSGRFEWTGEPVFLPVADSAPLLVVTRF